ncbi:copper-exporting ATPase [Sulfurifustis variabilis]|uniref:Copper-exporting ATPase n=1 Tax=Sulfurifustis variabilis TaxID=1675686 RepID=A0A1C7AEZ6_9GAMM|nr:YHS domain-containing protein [Sulfurifustis variabilis]BAU49778.1 copper-exporting ATPase [Sulfurifustis variabilis]
MAIDPVCKMRVEPEQAAAKAEYESQTYYFCSAACHKAFTADPHKYLGGHAGHGHGSPQPPGRKQR